MVMWRLDLVAAMVTPGVLSMIPMVFGSTRTMQSTSPARRALSRAELSLLDKDLLSEKIYYGYKSSGAFYNSLSIAQTFLTANAVPSSKILIYDPDADGFPRRERFDLIISLISWGFHYPVETYLEEVHGSLADDGVLILDLRKGTDGRRSLAARFASVETIVDAEKYERVLVRK
jgi:SAM-dependent methyltransferase